MPHILNQKFVSFLLFIFLINGIYSQCIITPPPSVTIACGGSTTLNGLQPAGSFGLSSTSCSPLPTGGTNAFATPIDDAVTGQIPIGFPFTFFGTTYNTAVISSNGLLGFGPFTYAGYGSFALPTTVANNFIAGFYADINIVIGGTITYQTIGTSPNQQFIVSYTNAQAFGGGGGTVSFQIVLNQSGSFQIIFSQLSANWTASTTGVLATSGVQNSTGTISIPVPGRNSTDWPGIVPGQQDCSTFGALSCTFQSWQIAGSNVSTAINYSVSPSSTTTYTGVWNCNGSICTANTTVTVPASPVTTNSVICAGATPTITSSSCGTIGTNYAQNIPFNNGELTNTDSKWNRNAGGTTCTASAGTNYYYDVFPFTVSSAGSYTFDGCFPTADGYGSLFQNTFNGANPCLVAANHIISNDDSNPSCSLDPRLTATLTPGITYYIISTTFGTNALGTYSWNFTGPAGATINSGGTGSALQWFTTAVGGTSISSVTPFNPVGVVGSGLANNTASGTYSYYAACASAPTCRTLATITINAPSILPTSISGTGNICAGASATLSVVGGTLSGGSNWEWFTGSCGGTLVGTGVSITVTPGSTTIYYVRASTGSTCPASTCMSGTVTVNLVPVISATPTSQALCSGEISAVVLSSLPTGSTFNWTVVQAGVNGATAGTGNSIAQSLTCNGTTSGTVTYTITPTLGICTGNPINVVITVNPVPAVLATPSTATICSGETTAIALSSISGTTFSWTVVQTGVLGASNGIGNSIAQTLSSSTTNTGTATYTITPTLGTCVGIPISVVINLNPVPSIIASPTSQSFCSGGTTAIALSSISGTSFDWTIAQNGVSGASIGSGSTINQTLSTTGTVAGTVVYTITPSLSNCVGNPITATITVNPVPVVLASPSAQTFCSGGTTNIVLSSIAGTTFGWTVVQNGVSGASTGSGSSISQTLSTTGSISGTVIYTITPTLGTCVGNPIIVTINVNPVPTAIASPTSQTFCSGVSSSISLSSIAGSTFDWTISQTGVSGASSGNGSSINQVLTNTGITSGTATYTITPTLGACVGASINVLINVNPIPVLITTPSSQTLCSGLTTGIALSSITGTTFAWTVTQNGSSGATNGSGSTISQILSSTGSSSGVAVYTITPTLGSCVGLPVNTTITINPVPIAVATPTAQTFCSGGSTSITLSSIAGTTFAWTSTPNSVTGGTSGNGTTISQVLSNSTTTSGTNTYTITPTLGICTGQAISVIETVNPLPIITVNSATYCNGGNAVLTASGASTYSWSPATNLSSTVGTSVTASPSNTSTYTVTGTSILGCTSNASSLVTVKPNPVVILSNNGPLCFGDLLNITAITSNVGCSFAWSGPVSYASNIQNPSIASVVYPNAGLYSLITTLNGCSSNSSTNVIINTGISTAINPIASICSNSSSFNLTSINPGGVWSGTAISNTSSGTFDPSLAAIGSNTVTYAIPGACTSPSNTTITMLQAPTVAFSADKVAGCGPLKVSFTDNSSPVGTTQNWNFGNGNFGNGSNSSATYLSPGCNTVTLISTSANGCFSSQTLTNYICVYTNPEVNFTSSVTETSINEPVIDFTNTSNGAINYVWNFGDLIGNSTAINPSYSYQNGGSYLITLIGENLEGCKDSSNLIVKVIDEISFFMPNSFTPNEDEFNNVFKPTITSGFDPTEFSFTIYNRWGELIFESKNSEIGWDGSFKGKLVQDGIYSWKIQYKAKDNDKRFREYGSVSLFR
jgi:gliding motility-associated-like protein